MEDKRVKEILNSPEMINVTYQNIPVWIDNLTSPGTVMIHDLNSDISMEVPSRELDELQL